MLGLTLDELFEIVRTCDAFELDATPPEEVQHYIAVRPEDRWPTLALAVLNFDFNQMAALHDFICECHRLTRGDK